MTRVIGPPRSRRRRWTFLWCLVVALGVGVFFIGGAQAVHSLGVFQLDPAQPPTSAPTGGANAQQGLHPAGITGDDWDNVCASNLKSPPVGDASCTFVTPVDANTSTTPATNATATTWGDDRAVTSGICSGGDNCTVFTTGSKDTGDLSTWSWKTDSGGLPKKDNLQQAFAARYTIPASTDCPNISGGPNCSVVYLGSTRMDNNGDAQQGFWFLQNRTAPNKDGSGAFCTVDTAGTCTGPAAHKAGDILIASDFSVGGATALISVFEWVDATCGVSTNVCSASDFPGDVSNNIKSLGGTPSGGTALCGFTPATDDRKFCGVVNFADGTISPWPFLDAANNTNFLHGELYEAGINITAFPGIGNECFATLAAESRSSAGNTGGTSINSTLKDFLVSNFGSCTSGLHTTANGPTGNGTIGTGSVSSGTDSATLTVTGAANWSGTLKFYLCGPIASGTCDSHGVLVSTVSVNQGTAQPIPSGNGTTTGIATLTSAGRYCWFGQFTSGTPGVPNASDDGSGTTPNPECFTVNPVTPTLTTSATCSANPCILGSTLSDTATLTGTANRPGSNGAGGDTGLYKSINATNGAPADSSISWTLYGPAGDGTAQCTTTKTLSPSTATVSGDNTYGPVTYTTNAGPPQNDGLGVYTFAASYSPADSVNTNAAADVTCANGSSNGERVTVTSQATTTTAQKWLPQDTATVTASGGATVAGNVTFKLYESADCSGTAVQTFGPTAVDSNGQATTNNQTYYTTTKTISWRATFTSTNNVDSGSPSHCETMSVSTLNNDLGPGS